MKGRLLSCEEDAAIDQRVPLRLLALQLIVVFDILEIHGMAMKTTGIFSFSPKASIG